MRGVVFLENTENSRESWRVKLVVAKLGHSRLVQTPDW
jgi:hypothetical protein